VFQRGFKTWCENTAVSLRKSVRLGPTEALDARRLADHLGIEVWDPQTIPGLDPKYLRVLIDEDADSWSAVTISDGMKDVIVLNPTHRGGRPASDLMHELSHIIIGHSPTRIDISENGLLILHTFDCVQEEEAKWLCGSLLLPRPALLLIRRLGLDPKTAAKKYGTSEQMVTFRLNVLGLAKRTGAFAGRASSGRSH
jgi:hypothetical protein